MLKLKFTDNRQEPFWVMEKNYAIGRADTNHLPIADATLDDYHAKIITKGDKFMLKDLASANGTCVNGQPIQQKIIACGDVLTLGDNVELEVVDPFINGSTYWSLIADSSWLSGQEFPLKLITGNSISIGRGCDCDMVFPGTHLSRNHAQVTIHRDHIVIRDMGSANGTYINDKKIEEAKAFPGDRIRFDVYSFKVFGPGIKLAKSATASFRAINDADIQVSKETTAQKQKKEWKSRPTSPGNREEVNLYQSSKLPNLLAGAVVLGALAAVAYVALNIFGA